MLGFKERFTSALPPAPCTDEMHDKVRAIAKQEGTSVSDVIRAALSLFLQVYDSNSIAAVNKAIGEEKLT